MWGVREVDKGGRSRERGRTGANNTRAENMATHLLSQMTALRSRWLVGSSSISSVGSMNSALKRGGVKVRKEAVCSANPEPLVGRTK